MNVFLELCYSVLQPHQELKYIPERNHLHVCTLCSCVSCRLESKKTSEKMRSAVGSSYSSPHCLDWQVKHFISVSALWGPVSRIHQWKWRVPSSSALFLLLLIWFLFRQISSITLFDLQSHHHRMSRCLVIMWHEFPQSIWTFDQLSPISAGLNQCSHTYVQNMSQNLGSQSPSWNVLLWCWCSTVSLK